MAFSVLFSYFHSSLNPACFSYFRFSFLGSIGILLFATAATAASGHFSSRRTQKEKNTSPPALAMFAAALKRLGAFSRLNTPLKATISTKHKKEQTKIQSGRQSMK